MNTVVVSPARINLIGEHTDYNDGFVLPAAINFHTTFTIRSSTDDTSTITSSKYNESFAVDLDNLQPVTTPQWVNYLLGVLYKLAAEGYSLAPFHCSIESNIPVGAGLSSSASLTCGFTYALSGFNKLEISREKITRIGQWAEHHYAGVRCGIMDQFANMMGKADHAILLDCRSLDYEYIPVNLPDHTIVLCDSKVHHALAASEYNTRRGECEEGISILRKFYPEVRSLRDIAAEHLHVHRADLPSKIFQRCLYVVNEISRVQEAADDLRRNHLHAFGKRMFETHEGLSKEYEVSCRELDFLVNLAANFNGVIGARMMGGGFGGCTINIVEKSAGERFIHETGSAFKSRFGHVMEAYIVRIEDGTNVVAP